MTKLTHKETASSFFTFFFYQNAIYFPLKGRIGKEKNHCISVSSIYSSNNKRGSSAFPNPLASLLTSVAPRKSSNGFETKLVFHYCLGTQSSTEGRIIGVGLTFTRHSCVRQQCQWSHRLQDLSTAQAAQQLQIPAAHMAK